MSSSPLATTQATAEPAAKKAKTAVTIAHVEAFVLNGARLLLDFIEGVDPAETALLEDARDLLNVFTSHTGVLAAHEKPVPAAGQPMGVVSAPVLAGGN